MSMQSESRKFKKRFSPEAWMQFGLPAVGVTLILWSCLAASPPGSPATHRLPLETIWAGSQCGCGARKPLVRWFTDQNQLTAAAAATGPGSLEARVARHPMDWTRNGIVWICMGLKPSGGYALSLADSSAAVSKGVAQIRVHWRQPRPGSVVTQQLTSPCLLLSVAREGFHTIQIKDEAGRVRANLEIDNK